MGESVCTSPLRTVSQFTIACVSHDINPIGLENWWFWRLISQMQVLIVGMPNVSFRLFAPQEEVCICELPLDCGLLCHRWGL